MSARLEQFRTAAEQQHSSQWRVQQKEEEIGALQKGISDLQVCLFQEREQVCGESRVRLVLYYIVSSC